MADPNAFEARGDFINGEFRMPESPVDEIKLEDPGDLEALSGAFPVSFDGIDEAIGAARRAWPAWRDAPAEQRAAALRRFAHEIESDREALARTISIEVGKPLWEARAEVKSMVGKIPVTLGDGLESIAERHFQLEAGQIGRVRARPRGVLAVLGPFNFPGHLVHGHVIPALATGNTVVVKPSDKTPAVGQHYAELALRAGLPPGVLNVVQGKADVGSRLAAHEAIDGVLFTGSSEVGQMILEATLQQPWKMVALEMGGKNGTLVCDDADIDTAVYAVAFGACATTGQRCSSTSRAIVDRRVAPRFLEGLVYAMGGLAIGHGPTEDPFMGPLISAAARDRHAQVIEMAQQERAECLLLGGAVEAPRKGHYSKPSIHQVTALRTGSRYQMEEHFVPDISVLLVDSFEEGLEALNAPSYGLVGSVISASRQRYEQAVRESRLGCLNWNTATVGASSRLPFGGQGRSGNDWPAGAAAVQYCTYPMASIEVEQPGVLPRHPGMAWPR